MLLVSISGFWPITGLVILSAAIGFALCAGIYHNNAANLNEKFDAVQSELNKLKAGVNAGVTAAKKV